MSPLPLRVAVFAVVAFGTFAAPAPAATICVPDAAPGGCDSVATTIQGAVDAAASGDTIRIAAGRYDEAVDAGAKTMHFAGVGGVAEITPPWGPGATLPALRLSHGGSLRSMRIAGGSGGSGDGGTGMAVGTGPGTTAGVAVVDSTVVGGSAFQSGGSALDVSGNGLLSVTIARSRISGGFGRPGQWPAIAASGASVTLANCDVSGGVDVSDAWVTVDHSTLSADTAAHTASAGIVALNARAPVSVMLRDSLVVARPGAWNTASESAAAIVVGSDLGTASLTATGTTFYAGSLDSGDPDAGVLVRRAADSNQSVMAVLRNSIVRLEGGTGAELVADRAEIAADYSGFSTARAVNGGRTSQPGSRHNVPGDPKLAGDFTLLPSSPLIDRGDPAIVTAGERDRAGDPRSTDGNGDCVALPDVGAFERPGICRRPVVSGFSMTRRAFAHRTRFRYTLSEPAKVSIAIERRHHRVGVLRATERAGRQGRHFNGRIRGHALRPGRYRARIVATDHQGAKSKPRRLTFRIVRP